MPAKWINIKKDLESHGIHVSIPTLKNWVKKYNLPILRLPNGWPYLTQELFEKWVVRLNVFTKKES